MANNKKTPGTADLTVRVPAIVKKSLDDLARKEANSTNSVIRRFITDGIEAAKRKSDK
jgi:predicted transcriptional regulator